jgi:LPXTG-site transpeptidase (sortase) family protein
VVRKAKTRKGFRGYDARRGFWGYKWGMAAQGGSAANRIGWRVFGWVGGVFVLAGLVLVGYAAMRYFVTPPVPAFEGERREAGGRDGTQGDPPALAGAPVGVVELSCSAAMGARALLPEFVGQDEGGEEPGVGAMGEDEPEIAAIGRVEAGGAVVGLELEPTRAPVVFVSAERPWRITIPAIGVDAPVERVELVTRFLGDVQVTQWAAPNGYAAGWHNGSAMPGAPGDGGGNTVLNGHHNIYGAVFGRLVELEMGAEIVVYSGDGVYRYEVTERVILAERDEPVAVRVQNAGWIAPTVEERLTLVTCWPEATNSHRLIVTARPVDDGPEEEGG